MSSIDREEEIKRSLKEDIYTHLIRLENLEDDTFASTKRLANILEGYVTKVDDLTIEEENKVLEILEELEVNIEASDERILTEYNAKFHEMGLDTLSQILEIPLSEDEFEEPIELEKENTITMMKIEHDDQKVDNENEFKVNDETIEIDSSDLKEEESEEKIQNTEEIAPINYVEKHKKKSNKRGNLSFIDYMLFLIVLILIIIIGFIFLGGS